MTASTVLLLGAGVLAGAVGSAGGTASLISYPALLAAGLPPLAANVTNSVAFVASWPGAAISSRPELRGRACWLTRWAAIAAAGGAAGASLLLLTPASIFGRVVPFLVAAASLALFLQPRLSAWRDKAAARYHRVLLPAGLAAVSVYDGYWGAGAGVMTLALLLVTVDQRLPHANALKNMILGVADIVSAVGLALLGPVRWSAALPLAAGLLAGSSLGPVVARRLPAGPLRVCVALAGLGLAVHLWTVPAS